MFKSMLVIRLKSIFKHLFFSAGMLGLGILCLMILDLFFSKKIHFSTYLFTIVRGFSVSLLFVWLIVLIVLSFRMTRPYLEFGLQNGVSRRINFFSHILSMIIGQLVVLMIAYPLFLWSLDIYQLPKEFYSPIFLLQLNGFVFTLLAGGIQVSSFITLFDKKIWGVIFIFYMISNWVFNQFIKPIIHPFIPSWLDNPFFELTLEMNNSNQELSTNLFFDALNSSAIGALIIGSILFSLVIAAICQYFIQVKRISLGLVRSK